MKLSFVVPGPPVPCARPRTTIRKGKVVTYTPDKTQAYKEHVRWLAAIARARAERGAHTWNMHSACFALALRVYRHANRGDWDNYAKVCQDALTGILWRDDTQVKRAVVEFPPGPEGWGIDRKNPRVEVEVEVIEQ